MLIPFEFVHFENFEKRFKTFKVLLFDYKNLGLFLSETNKI